ncbi:MAG: hypothetical protein HOP19_13680 [Acidobacteria bacterium]|nr:hypothetical protein [Acidobacteriota bacterium]
MTCEQIRESVEIVNVSEAAAHHAKTCTACRKDMAATAKLVGLLNTQPQVKAPADFMARLQMRMATETVNEDARLKSLLQAVPAVTAPADFSFRLRARLAQHKAQENVSNPLVWLQNWFAQSFSFRSAATAMAAVALIAMFTTMQLRQGVSTPETQPATAEIASHRPATVPAPVSVMNASQASVKMIRTARPVFAAASTKALAATPVKVEIAPALPAEMAVPALYSPQSKQMAPQREGYFGRELAKVMPAQKAESEVSVF